MDRLRVVHVIDSLAPGGTERQCAQLAGGLSNDGAESAVFYFRSGPLLRELERSGVPARHVPQGSIRSGRFFGRLVELARAIRRWDPAAVQTYGFYSDLRGLVAARLAGVPVRVAGRREMGRYLSRAQRRANRWAWGLAQRVVVNSEAVRRQVIAEERVTPGKVVVIRNGLDLGQWPAAGSLVDDHDDAVVGMVAHFRPDKDHVTFFDAAREVLQIIPSVRFCLIGSGALEVPMRERAARLGIADRVDFLGRLEPDAVRAAVLRFRIAVLASKDNEGLPNAVLEAMAAARPVVATAVGGTPEVIEDGVTGFVVSPGDAAALAERIVRLLKDPPLARSMGERGRQRVEREFTMERMARQYHALYRRLLDARHRDR
jgi:glycosyltransferase involved in cell wall biosynthesis